MECFTWLLMKKNMLPFHKLFTLIAWMTGVMAGLPLSAQKHISKRQFKKKAMTCVQDTVFNHASLSIQFTSLKDGKTLFATDEHRALIPASILKIMSCKLMLDAYGPEFCFRTPIFLQEYTCDSGNVSHAIKVRGSGDPSFCSPYMKDAISLDSLSSCVASALKRIDVDTIQQEILIDQGWLQTEFENPEWLYYDLGNYYGSTCSALNYRENEWIIQIAPAAAPGGYCPVFWHKKWLNPSAFYSRVVGVEGLPQGDRYVLGSSAVKPKPVIGQWKVGGNDTATIRASMAEPSEEFVRDFSLSLQNHNILMHGFQPHAVDSVTPVKEFALCEVVSPPLKQIVQRALDKSVNLYCESFLLKLAEKWSGTTNRDSGLNYLNNMIRLSLPKSVALQIKDGSGLSPKNLMSAFTMNQFLMNHQYTSGNEAFYPYLTNVHINGSLKKYLQTKPSPSKAIFAKSGSMERVRAYAGYLVEDGKPVAVFSIMVNNFQSKPQAVQEKIAGLLDQLMLVKLD